MIGTTRFILLYLILTASWGYLHFHADRSVPVAKPLAEFPAVVNTWQMVSQTQFSSEVITVLKPTDYLYRHYKGSGDRNVSLYIGFHDGGKGSGEIHSPKHCLPGNGWQEVASDQISVALPQGKVSLVKAVYQKGESRELFLYWFQVQEKSLSNEYSLKCAEIMNSVLHRRRDAAFIRISVPLQPNEKGAETTAVNFVEDIYPLIRQFLPS